MPWTGHPHGGWPWHEPMSNPGPSWSHEEPKHCVCTRGPEAKAYSVVIFVAPRPPAQDGREFRVCLESGLSGEG